MSAFVVVVKNRPEFPDPAATEAEHLLGEEGLASRGVRAAQLYRVEGLGPQQVRRLAQAVLVDPVTQEFGVETPGEPAAPKGKKSRGPVTRLDIWLKPAVSDPVAPSIVRGAAALGLEFTVRCGQRLELPGVADADHARRAAFRALANPLLHALEVGVSAE